MYALPAVPYIGTDDFRYTVGDGTGEQTEGTVRVTARSSTLVGTWPLDDGPDDIPDATGRGFDGTAVGAPQAASCRCTGSPKSRIVPTASNLES